MGEKSTLADTTGRIARIVEDGHKRNDLEWEKCRLVLSSDRLVVVTNDDQRHIEVDSITAVKSRSGLGGDGEGYLSVQVGSDVDILAPTVEGFGDSLYSAVLDQRTVLIKHPALKGGVVQDTGWDRGRIKIGDGTVDLAVSTGSFVEVEVSDVGTVERAEKSVGGETRDVVEIEHTVDGTSVETHVSGARRDANVLFEFLRRETATETDVDLDDDERAVLMALYSGVSPFEIPDFVDLEIDRVEQIYDGLLESGLLREVRTRRSVSLLPRGRNIATEEMAEQ
ncbi:CheF family chemotaxis protein [Halococcoides cellulosivorans]|uniref:Taxis protein CheF n=1 Tax=Halococcoides cellulosivorans TaxID=1679096 RepID=A0A2R4X4G1_9EURY|nr:CheF family chemotaxis protein [Halococcoides cellulosivorans]AWB28678.1 chemotaxis protein CheF1 [Halococcoides cellulosivorans]